MGGHPLVASGVAEQTGSMVAAGVAGATSPAVVWANGRPAFVRGGAGGGVSWWGFPPIADHDR